MKVMVFSIFDTVAKIYSQPMFISNTGLMLRSFADEVKNKDSNLHRHSEDMKLYQVGEWDDVAGELVVIKPPKFVANAVDFKEKENG